MIGIGRIDGKSGRFGPVRLFLGLLLRRSKKQVNHGTCANIFKKVCGYAKMSIENVRLARRLYATGEFTHRQLAQRFDLSLVAMDNLLSGKSWKHIT